MLAYAFFFSAIVITLLGETLPQAYFSRNAPRMTSRFLPFLRIYLFVLYLLTKPTAMVLDREKAEGAAAEASSPITTWFVKSRVVR